VPDTAKTRVLVIDDASLVRLYYRGVFERAGYAVDEALNGIEALERLLVRGADLLIVDVNMPQMDGFTFLRTLRRQELAIAAIPALVISTEAGLQDKEAAARAGANFYLVKPVTPEALLACADLMTGRQA
jgi:two-component system, chemotaxis family, chemotaxis protein CheY